MSRILRATRSGRALAAVIVMASYPVAAARADAEEQVTIASGGWRLAGDLEVPEVPAPAPAVILLNKAAGDRGAHAGLARQLAAMGIASLRVDLRGHGESTNRGRFVPGEGTEILDGSEEDVAAARDFLRRDPRIDPDRIGFVGASYSGEVMMEAARRGGYGAAYVALSPGSLSDESIGAIDREGLPFLLVVSRHERYLVEVARELRDQSRGAQFLELEGTAHATDLLAAHPGLAELIAVWFRQRFEPPDVALESTETTQGDEDVSQAEHDRRVDYIEFPATSIEETKRFYSQIFGWRFTDYGPEYTSFTDGRLAGGFAVAPEVKADGPLIVIYATDLEEIEARIRASGGRIVKEVFEFPGGRRFHFSDPSGNELAVWSDR